MPSPYSDTITSTWWWTGPNAKWKEELRLALDGDTFGRDTGMVTRLGEVVRIGDLLRPVQEPLCPCAVTPYNQTDWVAIAQKYPVPPNPVPPAQVRPKVYLCDPPWDVEDCGRRQLCPPCNNPDYPGGNNFGCPECEGFASPPAHHYFTPMGWDGRCQPLPNFLPRPPKPYIYFVYFKKEWGIYVGRSFFQCETSKCCSKKESQYFYTIDFGYFEYYGNLVDTPEKFVQTLSAEIDGVPTPDQKKFGSAYVNKVREASHFY
jgi:hypothetical protein